MMKKVPIRVIRGKLGGAAFVPSDPYRYDGIYWVTFVWKERKSDDEFMKIRLVRAKGQAPIPKTSTEIDKITAGKLTFDPKALEQYSYFKNKEKIVQESKKQPIVEKTIQKTVQIPRKVVAPIPKEKPKPSPVIVKKPVEKSPQKKLVAPDTPKPITKPLVKTKEITQSIPSNVTGARTKLSQQTQSKPKVPLEMPPKKKQKPSYDDESDGYDSDFIDDSESQNNSKILHDIVAQLFPTSRKYSKDEDLDDIEEVKSFSSIEQEETRARKIAVKEDKAQLAIDEKRRKDRAERLSKK